MLTNRKLMKILSTKGAQGNGKSSTGQLQLRNSKAFEIVEARPSNPDYKEDREKILKRRSKLIKKILKHTSPIRKMEIYINGGTEWSSNGNVTKWRYCKNA